MAPGHLNEELCRAAAVPPCAKRHLKVILAAWQTTDRREYTKVRWVGSLMLLTF